MNPYLFLYSVFIGTASIVCGAGSTKRYGVRLSVCLSAAWLVGVEFNAVLHTIYRSFRRRCPLQLLQVCCCGPCWQAISIDCCGSDVVGVRR